MLATSTLSLLHRISHKWDKLLCFSGWVGWFEKLQPWRGQRQLHNHFPSTPLCYSQRTRSSWIQVTLLGLFLCIPTTVLRLSLYSWKKRLNVSSSTSLDQLTSNHTFMKKMSNLDYFQKMSNYESIFEKCPFRISCQW